MEGTLDPAGMENGCDYSDKSSCKARWTKREILVLVAAKKSQEESFRDPACKGKAVCADERWESLAVIVSSEGIPRTARQCRKRWFNMAADYKKIRDWHQQTGGVESFWEMGAVKRKENRLPINFDIEVFREMDSFLARKPLVFPDRPSLVTGSEAMLDADLLDVNFCGPAAAPAFLEPEDAPAVEAAGSVGQKKKKHRVSGGTNGPHKDSATGLDGCNKPLQGTIVASIQALIEVQKTMMVEQARTNRLDRIERRKQTSSFVGVLTKLADAVNKIGDKL